MEQANTTNDAARYPIADPTADPTLEARQAATDAHEEPEPLRGLARGELLAHITRVHNRLIPVPLPWVGAGAGVYVRGLDATGKDLFEDRVYSVDPATKKLKTKVDGIRALLICLCTCDEAGNPLFTEKDLPQLAHMDGKTADAIYAVASRESGFTQQDVDEMVKNSERARTAGRSSVSR